MYKFIADRYGERLPALNTSSGNRSVTNSLVNLAVVYASIDNLEEALNVLSLASSRTDSAKEKAEILYRIAEINWNLGDSRSASRSIKYALTLDNTHNRARLLQKKIKMAKYRHLSGSASKISTPQGMAPKNGPKKGITLVTPTMTLTSGV